VGEKRCARDTVVNMERMGHRGKRVWTSRDLQKIAPALMMSLAVLSIMFGRMMLKDPPRPGAGASTTASVSYDYVLNDGTTTALTRDLSVRSITNLPPFLEVSTRHCCYSG
jgi:hypothetical protein